MKGSVFQRDAFIDEIFVAAKNDRDIVFVSADFGAPALDRFREQLPLHGEHDTTFSFIELINQHLIEKWGYQEAVV